jgi:hypothetical protein
MVTLPNVALAFSLLSYAAVTLLFFQSSIRLLKKMDRARKKEMNKTQSQFRLIIGQNHPDHRDRQKVG